MQKDRPIFVPLLALGCLAAALAAGFVWFGEPDTGTDATLVTNAVVVVTPSAAATHPLAPPVAALPASAPGLPSPQSVAADVRQAYPLLTNVEFRCDAGGCAVTATIPPPTDDAFLKARQDMLVGGLARILRADGYTMLEPVQMKEVDVNLFHIRAVVTPGQDTQSGQAAAPR